MKYSQLFPCFNKRSYKYQHWNPKHKECIFHTDQSIIKSFYHVSILSHKSSIHRALKCFLKEIYSFHINNSDYNSSRMKNKQMSETFLLAMIITFSGGLQDAYTYFARNKVFANAQTGNIVLMASKLSDGQYADAIRYVFPLLSFALGIFVAEQIQGYYKEAKKLHWRQTILIIEIISLFVSGCTHHCKNCFNQMTWDFKYGKEFNQEVEDLIIDYLKPEHITGLSLLGGEPMEPSNQRALVSFVKRVKETYPQKDIWCYTGYDFEKDILGRMTEQWEETKEMLSYIDVLVDGEFKEALKSPSLQFKGSSNQRIIEVQPSLKEGHIVLWEPKEYVHVEVREN